VLKKISKELKTTRKNKKKAAYEVLRTRLSIKLSLRVRKYKHL